MSILKKESKLSKDVLSLREVLKPPLVKKSQLPDDFVLDMLHVPNSPELKELMSYCAPAPTKKRSCISSGCFDKNFDLKKAIEEDKMRQEKLKLKALGIDPDKKPRMTKSEREAEAEKCKRAEQGYREFMARCKADETYKEIMAKYKNGGYRAEKIARLRAESVYDEVLATIKGGFSSNQVKLKASPAIIFPEVREPMPGGMYTGMRSLMREGRIAQMKSNVRGTYADMMSKSRTREIYADWKLKSRAGGVHGLIPLTRRELKPKPEQPLPKPNPEPAMTTIDRLVGRFRDLGLGNPEGQKQPRLAESMVRRFQDFTRRSQEHPGQAEYYHKYYSQKPQKK